MRIFDIGFYNGADTRYYLARGAAVVAFEANPALVAAGRKTFAKAIKAGQLEIHNLAISDRDGTVPFFIHTDNAEWSTAFELDARNWGEGKYSVVEVPAITGEQLYAQFGIPDYVKSDIEGYDHLVINPLLDMADKPALISVEASNPDSLTLLMKAGYDSFKIVDQADVPESRTLIDGQPYVFPVSSTGPYGDEAAGPWLSYSAVRHLHALYAGNPFGQRLPHGHWWDIHATRGRQAERDMQIAALRAFIERYETLLAGEDSQSALTTVPEASQTYTRMIADDWADSAYYGDVESQASRNLFWGEASPFKAMFDRLDLTRVIEIACGHGRHLEHYFDKVSHALLLDINQSNVDVCRRRHTALSDRVDVRLTDGRSLSGARTEDYTAVFCYDAMVHFELFDVIGYLRESCRVLKPGGLALFHHSNWTGAPGIRATLSQEFGWRNYMSVDLFTHLADRCGFEVLEQRTITWGGRPNLDGITLLRKPD